MSLQIKATTIIIAEYPKNLGVIVLNLSPAPVVEKRKVQMRTHQNARGLYGVSLPHTLLLT